MSKTLAIHTLNASSIKAGKPSFKFQDVAASPLINLDEAKKEMTARFKDKNPEPLTPVERATKRYGASYNDEKKWHDAKVQAFNARLADYTATASADQRYIKIVKETEKEVLPKNSLALVRAEVAKRITRDFSGDEYLNRRASMGAADERAIISARYNMITKGLKIAGLVAFGSGFIGFHYGPRIGMISTLAGAAAGFALGAGSGYYHMPSVIKNRNEILNEADADYTKGLVNEQSRVVTPPSPSDGYLAR